MVTNPAWKKSFLVGIGEDGPGWVEIGQDPRSGNPTYLDQRFEAILSFLKLSGPSGVRRSEIGVQSSELKVRLGLDRSEDGPLGETGPTLGGRKS